jgi:glyoxylase-like metal-dependent hydrolase (beta-lactamase superfamily II)
MTTSGVVFGAEGALVIDPNLLPREIAMVQVYVEQSAKPARYVVYTHHHWDHILGGQAFPSARRLAHRRLPEEMARNRAENQIRQFDAEYYVQRDPPFEFLPPHELIDDGWTGNLGEMEFRLIHLPGHAVDMVGVHIPVEKTLFAADMLSDVELPMIDGDGCDYLASLRKVDEMVTAGQVETLVPGHGHITLGAEAIRARIAEDIAYIDRLRMVVGGKLSEGEEAAIEACRSMGYRGKNGWPPMAKTHEANVKEVYRAMGGSCFSK